MAYDEQLAARVRELMAARPDVVERKMFGGVGWMVGGNMAVGVMSTDALMVRMEPDEVAAAIREPHVHEFGREGAKPMKGFVVVEPEAVEHDDALARWVDVGAARAASMPPK
jgi:TfoX/Sxy family transcriptional regulator of competence genes